MGTDKATAADQAEARARAAITTTRAFGEFKDHAGQEEPAIRGKTKAELDASGKAA